MAIATAEIWCHVRWSDGTALRLLLVIRNTIVVMFRCSPFARGSKFRCNPTDHKYIVITTDHRVRPTTWRSRRRTGFASRADHHSWSRLLRPQQSPLSSVQRPPTTVAGGKEEQKTKKQYQPLNYDKVLLLIRFISSNDSVSFKSYCDAHTEYLG